MNFKVDTFERLNRDGSQVIDVPGNPSMTDVMANYLGWTVDWGFNIYDLGPIISCLLKPVVCGRFFITSHQTADAQAKTVRIIEFEGVVRSQAELDQAFLEAREDFRRFTEDDLPYPLKSAAVQQLKQVRREQIMASITAQHPDWTVLPIISRSVNPLTYGLIRRYGGSIVSGVLILPWQLKEADWQRTGPTFVTSGQLVDSYVWSCPGDEMLEVKIECQPNRGSMRVSSMHLKG